MPLKPSPFIQSGKEQHLIVPEEEQFSPEGIMKSLDEMGFSDNLKGAVARRMDTIQTQMEDYANPHAIFGRRGMLGRARWALRDYADLMKIAGETPTTIDPKLYAKDELYQQKYKGKTQIPLSATMGYRDIMAGFQEGAAELKLFQPTKQDEQDAVVEMDILPDVLKKPASEVDPSQLERLATMSFQYAQVAERMAAGVKNPDLAKNFREVAAGMTINGIYNADIVTRIREGQVRGIDATINIPPGAVRKDEVSRNKTPAELAEEKAFDQASRGKMSERLAEDKDRIQAALQRKFNGLIAGRTGKPIEGADKVERHTPNPRVIKATKAILEGLVREELHKIMPKDATLTNEQLAVQYDRVYAKFGPNFENHPLVQSGALSILEDALNEGSKEEVPQVEEKEFGAEFKNLTPEAPAQSATENTSTVEEPEEDEKAKGPQHLTEDDKIAIVTAVLAGALEDHLPGKTNVYRGPDDVLAGNLAETAQDISALNERSFSGFVTTTRELTEKRVAAMTTQINEIIQGTRELNTGINVSAFRAPH